MDKKLSIVQLGVPNLNDVPDSLRRLADAMERGEEPAAVHAMIVAVDEAGGMVTYGYGAVGNAASEVGLLHMAAMQITLDFWEVSE